MCASVRGLRESRPGEDWKLLPLLTAVVAKSARSAPVALPRKPGCRMYIRWSTCSYNVAKVCIYIYIYIYIYGFWLYICIFLSLCYYCLQCCIFIIALSVFLLFIEYLNLLHFDVSWIFLFSIIFNIPLLYDVYCVLWCLETVLFSHERAQSMKDLQSTVVNPVNHLCSIPHYSF